jgi:hypothetical protein
VPVTRPWNFGCGPVITRLQPLLSMCCRKGQTRLTVVRPDTGRPQVNGLVGVGARCDNRHEQATDRQERVAEMLDGHGRRIGRRPILKQPGMIVTRPALG